MDVEIKEYEIFNLLFWLTKVAPNCPHAAARFAEFAAKHPKFAPREHADMDSWIGPVRWGWESPATDEELLSKPLDEQLEFLVSFRSEHPFGPSREGLIENVRKAVAQRYDWGMALAHALKRRGLWEPDLWEAILGGWQHTDLDPEKWQEILRLLLETEQVLTSVAHETSRLLEQGVAKSSNEIPDSCLVPAMQLAEKLWLVCTASDEPKPEKAKDWLTLAINRPAGILLEFLLHVLSRLRKQSGAQWKEIPQEYKQFLDPVISGNSYAAELGRVVLASQLHFIFSLDERWAVDGIVPLFSWSADPRRALQAWHGFLGWGRWHDPLLTHLMPLYEQAFPALHSEFGEFRQRFCEHLASIACLSSVNLIQNGWLNRFLVATSLEERVMWASSVGPMLAQMQDPAKQGAWDNWIRVYWQNRIEGLPMTLDATEVGHMVQWSVHLEPVFPEVVAKICDSPPPKLEHSYIYRPLYTSGLSGRYPDAMAKLLLHLLRHASMPLYDIDPIVNIVQQLAASDMRERHDVLSICDELARLGYTGAQRLREAVAFGREEPGSPTP